MNTSIQKVGVNTLNSRYVTILIVAAITTYVLSSVKFLVRDPLSSETGVQGLIEMALLGAAALLTTVAFWLRRAVPVITPTVAGFALFSGLMAVSSAWSYWPALSLIKGAMFFAVLAIVVVLCTIERPLTVLGYFYWISFAVIVLGLCLRILSQQPLFEIDDYSGRMRLTIFAWHPGTLADVSALTLLAGLLLTKRPLWVCQLFLLAINVATCARSSTALLVLIAAIVVACKYLMNIRGLAIAFLSVAVIAFAIFLVNNVQWPIVEKMEAKLQVFYGDKLGEDLGTLNGRTDVWKTTSDLTSHSVVLGYGLEGVRDKILQEETWAGNAHNAYLEILLAGGLPSLLIFLIVWTFSAFRALRNTTGLRLPVLGIYVYMFLFGFTEPNLTYLQALALFLIVCIDYALRTKRVLTPSYRVESTTEEFELYRSAEQV